MTRTRATGPGILVLAAATAVGSLGMAAGGTSGALAATEITGQPSTAGLPLGLLVAGSGVGALLISRWTPRMGRRAALAAGYLVGAVAAVVTVAAVGTHSFGLLLVGSAGQGVANAALFLTRYAAAERPSDARPGGTMGLVLAATTVGAVAGFNLLGPTGVVAAGVGLPRLAGLYLVAAPAFGLAALLLARGARRPAGTTAAGAPRRRITVGVAGVGRALAVLGATNLAMVATMAIAPVHLTGHGHGLSAVGAMVSVHVVCMFAPAPLWGRLGDVAGLRMVVGAAAVLFVFAGLLGAVANPAHGGTMTAVLALLGLGWSAGVMGGSALLAGSVPAVARPRAEGFGEVAMSLGAGAGAPLAGIVAAGGGFAALSLGAAAVGAAALVAAWPGTRPSRPVAAPGVSDGSAEVAQVA
jgi:MFS family permease